MKDRPIAPEQPRRRYRGVLRLRVRRTSMGRCSACVRRPALPAGKGSRGPCPWCIRERARRVDVAALQLFRRGPDSERIRAFLFYYLLRRAPCGHRVAGHGRMPQRTLFNNLPRGGNAGTGRLRASQQCGRSSDGRAGAYQFSRPWVRCSPCAPLRVCPCTTARRARRGNGPAGCAPGSRPMCSECTWPPRRPLALGRSRSGPQQSSSLSGLRAETGLQRSAVARSNSCTREPFNIRSVS